jgi:hypothetical protein
VRDRLGLELGPLVEVQREVGLRVHVEEQDLLAEPGERGAEVDRGRRLADTALLVDDRDDLHRVRSIGPRAADSERQAAAIVAPSARRGPPSILSAWI